MNKSKQELLQVLLEIVKVFERNDIWYSLSYGSLLGAVRHKGFIPWDDDIDIWIKGEDYSKIKSLVLSNNKLELYDCLTVKNYPYVFPKVGLKEGTLIKEKEFEHVDYKITYYIDLFFVSGFQKKKYNLLKESLYCKIVAVRFMPKQKRFYIKVLKLISRLFNIKKLQYKIYKLNMLELNDYDNIKVISKYKPELLKWNDIKLTGKLLFEGEEISTCVNFDLILKNYYDDYMEFPPQEKRISGHNIIEIGKK